TAAGNGTEAVCGDGGPATEACVWMPTGLAIDTGGNLLIAAYGGLRRVDATTGLISIIAGGGSAACRDGGPASEVGFDDATAVTVDRAGNILVADYGNGVVCRLDAVTHLTSVIPDSIGCGMGGVAVDSEGNVFFGATLVCRYDAGSGATTIVAGDGEYQCAPYPGRRRPRYRCLPRREHRPRGRSGRKRAGRIIVPGRARRPLDGAPVDGRRERNALPLRRRWPGPQRLPRPLHDVRRHGRSRR